MKEDRALSIIANQICALIPPSLTLNVKMMDLEHLDACTFKVCGTSNSPYGYRPSMPANAIFAVIYLATLIGCLLYTIPGRKWIKFGIPVSVACGLEFLGYTLRFAASFYPWNVGLFAFPTASLTVAPAFVSAGIYSTVPRIVEILGAEHSPIDPTRFPWLRFIDIGGLGIQLLGIIVAFSDLSSSTAFGPNANIGRPIVALGTGIQALSLLCFLGLFGVVICRALQHHRHYGYTTWHQFHGFVVKTRKFKTFVIMVIVSCLCLLARAIFHTVFLGAGFESSVAHNEALYLVFDGFLVVESVVGLILTHPASYLQDGVKQQMRSRSAGLSRLSARPVHSRAVSSWYRSGTSQISDASSMGGPWSYEDIIKTPPSISVERLATPRSLLPPSGYSSMSRPGTPRSLVPPSEYSMIESNPWGNRPRSPVMSFI
ncbi:RTA1 like protein-domain-containing protein [Xylariomycetidae sp. FL0641]|nr:RTA1 like protein-domain-containing protein [Xylariomycetidae sp. FL0641]